MVSGPLSGHSPGPSLINPVSPRGPSYGLNADSGTLLREPRQTNPAWTADSPTAPPRPCSTVRTSELNFSCKAPPRQRSVGWSPRSWGVGARTLAASSLQSLGSHPTLHAQSLENQSVKHQRSCSVRQATDPQGEPGPDPEGASRHSAGHQHPDNSGELGRVGLPARRPPSPGAPGTYRWPAAPGACRAPGEWHTYERRQACQS